MSICFPPVMPPSYDLLNNNIMRACPAHFHYAWVIKSWVHIRNIKMLKHMIRKHMMRRGERTCSHWPCCSVCLKHRALLRSQLVHPRTDISDCVVISDAWTELMCEVRFYFILDLKEFQPHNIAPNDINSKETQLLIEHPAPELAGTFHPLTSMHITACLEFDSFWPL